MKTPQEKAKELVEKYFNLDGCDWKTAKQCAIICVDEILSTDEVFSNIAAKYWWDEVKKEINNL